MISAMVEKQAIDLIVMGTHGRRGAKQLLLGSTAEEILRWAKTPLLMVGPGNFGATSNRGQTEAHSAYGSFLYQT
jgi:hypothetical protein